MLYDAVRANNPNLQPAQFDSGQVRAQPRAEVESPLPLSNNTNSSTKQAAAWRRPGSRVLSLAKATFGSTFRPFDN